MPLLNKACCYSLRTGNIIIGWIGVICSAIFVVLPIKLENIDYMFLTDGLNEKVLRFALLYMLTAGVIGLLVYPLLVFGSSNGNRFCLLPFLVYKMTCIVVNIFILLFLIRTSNTERLVVGLVTTLLWSLFIGLEVFCLVCALSLYQKIKLEETFKKK